MFAYWMFVVRGRRALDGDGAVARGDAPGGCGALVLHDHSRHIECHGWANVARDAVQTIAHAVVVCQRCFQNQVLFVLLEDMGFFKA